MKFINKWYFISLAVVIFLFFIIGFHLGNCVCLTKPSYPGMQIPVCHCPQLQYGIYAVIISAVLFHLVYLAVYGIVKANESKKLRKKNY